MRSSATVFNCLFILPHSDSLYFTLAGVHLLMLNIFHKGQENKYLKTKIENISGNFSLCKKYMDQIFTPLTLSMQCKIFSRRPIEIQFFFFSQI